MNGRLHRTLLVLCLVGFVFGLGLWAASMWGVTYISEDWMVTTFQGLLLWVEADYVELVGSAARLGFHVNSFSLGHNWAWLPERGFGPWPDAIQIPLWNIPAVFAIWPTIVLIRRLRRPREGYPSCGYDLAGNTSGTCPECGHPMEQQPQGD